MILLCAMETHITFSLTRDCDNDKIQTQTTNLIGPKEKVEFPRLGVHG